MAGAGKKFFSLLLLTQLFIPWQRSRMEVRPLIFSPLGAENPVPSGQVACVPNPLKVIVSFTHFFEDFLTLILQMKIFENKLVAVEVCFFFCWNFARETERPAVLPTFPQGSNYATRLMTKIFLFSNLPEQNKIINNSVKFLKYRTLCISWRQLNRSRMMAKIAIFFPREIFEVSAGIYYP